MKNILIPINLGNYYIIGLNESDFNCKAIQSGISNILSTSYQYDYKLKECIDFISNNSNIGEFIYSYVVNNIENFLNKNILKMKSEFIIECFGGHVELIHQLNDESSIEWYVEFKIRQQILKAKPLMNNLNNKIMELI